jgi:magnesium-transporting ATPase (P-type)
MNFIKKQLSILKKSINTKLPLLFVFFFLLMMITVGTQGQRGLVFEIADAIIYTDPLAEAVRTGQSNLEPFSDENADEQIWAVQKFFAKTLFATFLAIAIPYLLFVLVQVVGFQYQHKHLFSVKGYKQAFLLNLVWFLLLIPIAFMVLIVYLGFVVLGAAAQWYVVPVIMANIIVAITIVVAIYLTFLLNRESIQTKGIFKTMHNSIMSFIKNISHHLTNAALFFVVLLLLALVTTQISLQFPALFGVGTALSLTIPLAWLMTLIEQTQDISR